MEEELKNMEQLLKEIGFTRCGYWGSGNIDKATETGEFAIVLQLEPREARDGYAYVARAISGELGKHLRHLRSQYSKARGCWTKQFQSSEDAESAACTINSQAMAGGLTP